jgi:hypothetical protein
MKNDKSNVQFLPHSKGDLLQEVVRAYLHSGNPSALLDRIVRGVVEYRAESSGTKSIAEVSLEADLTEKLYHLYASTRKAEDNLPIEDNLPLSLSK